MAEIKVSNKGKPLLYHEGFIYNKFETKLNGLVTSWRCSKRCGGWITQCGQEYTLTKKHNYCHPSPTATEVRQLKTALKQRAISHPYEKPSNTVAVVKRLASLHAVPHLPTELSLKSTIARHRRENQEFQVTGATRTTLFIPEKLLKTHRGANYLAYDSADEDRILIFATDRNLIELGMANVWLCDGTFKVAPEMYTQVFSVHAAVDGWILPLAFGLLPDKKLNTYQRFFENLRKVSKGNITTPEVIITDFEMAEIGAIHKVYETASIQGCFFHLSQNLHRNLPKEVLTQIKDGDKTLEHCVKKFAAFAFLPPNHVDIIFHEFKKQIDAEFPILKPFATYFEETYVGTVIQGPRFSVGLWNVYHRVNANIPRTNNAVEGYNNRMNNKINASHPGITRLLQLFKDEQSFVEDCLQVRLVGGDPPKKVEKYAKLNERLVKLVKDYDYSHRWNFLDGIAHNLMGIKSIKKPAAAARPDA